MNKKKAKRSLEFIEKMKEWFPESQDVEMMSQRAKRKVNQAPPDQSPKSDWRTHMKEMDNE